LVTMNPAAQVSTKYIGRHGKRTRALNPSEIRIVLRTLDASDIQRQFKLAVHITLLTLTRKSELRLAEWKHVNLETGEWFIPAANTKTNTDHLVFLAPQLIEMFRELEMLACGADYVLPGRNLPCTKPMHGNSLNAALDRLEFNIPAFHIHDLRRTASTILHGNHFQPDVIELALGHKIPGMRGVYNVAQYEPERRKMLAWWVDYVERLVNESKVVVGNFGA
jgi:integrase